MTMIEVENLSKRYGDKLAVDGLSFVVQPGIVTGFLGPNGAGKSTTMRMIAGLDEPTTGRVIVNGGDYRSAAAPMAELGVLLEAKAVHTGRSARNHLLALAQTNGISRQRVDEVIDIVGLRQVAGQRVGGFSLGHGPAARAWRRRCWATRRPWSWTSRSTAWTPKGVRWMRTMLKDLAADGHTVFVSSPPDERDGPDRNPAGRHRSGPADRRHHGRRSSSPAPRITPSPSARRRRPACGELLLGPDITVTTEQPDVLRGRRPDRRTHRHHRLAGPHPHLRADRPTGLPGRSVHDTDQRLRRVPLHRYHRHADGHCGGDGMTAALRRRLARRHR